MFAVNVDVVIDVVKYAQTAHLKLGNLRCRDVGIHIYINSCKVWTGPNAVTIYVEIKYWSFHFVT